MSLIFRLAGRGFVSPLFKQDTGKFLSYARTVTMKCVPVEAPKSETHDERNMRLGRPQSPHLTIYKPQLTSVLSVSHRATGIALTAYTIAFSMAAVSLPLPLESYIEQLRIMELGAAPIFAVKFMLSFPLTYHFWNGIRHMLWDTGRYLTIKEVYLTGWVMLALATTTATVLSA